jgi:multiple sugar transport system permease protein
MNHTLRRRLALSARLLAIALVLMWTLFPLWWAVALSIKHPPDFFTSRALPWLQFQPTLDNWAFELDAFDDPAGMGNSLAGSILVGVASTGVALLLGVPAAFGLSQQRRRPAWWVFGLVLLPRLMPPVVVVFAYSEMMRVLRLNDTYTALAIAHATLVLPFTVLLPYSALIDLPRDIFDAARVDGCTPVGVLRRIALPLLSPMLLATAALCFALSWNEFVFALMNVQQHAQTAPLAVASLLNKDGVEFEYVGSHLVMVVVAPLVLALLARRYLVRGLTLGTVKGEEGGGESADWRR